MAQQGLKGLPLGSPIRSTGLRAIEDPQGYTNLNKLPLELYVIFTSIKEAISKLNKLAISIRQSSRSIATIRTRRYAAENLDLSRFENISSVSLESLYPNAPDGLLD